MSASQEKLTVLQVSADMEWQEFDGDLEIQNILSDFDKLDFSNGPFNDPADDMNYNEGKEANSFDKIAKYYGRNKNVFLFISLLRDEEASEKMIDLVSKKCDALAKEKFMQRMKKYLDRMEEGELDAKLLFNNDLAAIFSGYHVECPGHARNIHENLNIFIAEPGQTLETSMFFSRTTERMEEEKSEIKKAKIYIHGGRITTITKNEKQQRNYKFTELATCDIEIIWRATDKTGTDLDCALVLNMSSGEISVRESTIGGEDAKLKKMLKLAKQNKAVRINGRALHEVLAEHLNTD